MLLQHPMLQQYLLNYELPHLAWICISSMIIREWLLHLQGIRTGKHLPFWILQPMTLASNSHQDSGHPNLRQEPLRDTRIYWPESIDFASSNTEAIDCLPSLGETMKTGINWSTGLSFCSPFSFMHMRLILVKNSGNKYWPVECFWWLGYRGTYPMILSSV